jgi:acetolactate synthase-1/2/3 large subunit
VPGAIGAKLAQPLRPTVLLSGDGGFQFNLQELAVAVQFDVPIVIVLLNDGGYGALEPQQQMRYGRSFVVDLENPDFVALAAAYGIEGGRVDSIAALGPAITEAIESGQARLIELPIQLPPQIMESAARAMFLAGLNDSKH